MSEAVLSSVDGNVARITLNRPDKRNAFDRPMWQALTHAFAAFADRADVGCVLLTAAGEAFSSGADIAEFFEARSSAEAAAAYGLEMEAAYRAIATCPVPVVAAVGGACTGAGLVVALSADLRIAAEDARFGIPVSRLGLAMPLPELAVVAAAIGRARALDLLLTARLIDSRQAEAWGIVTQVVATPALDEAAARTAQRIAAGPRAVNALHKRLVGRLTERAEADRPEDRAASYAPFDQGDYREGIEAFLEKRKPRFAGS